MERLRKRSDFLAAATGGKVPTAGFVLQARARAESGPVRIGFTVSRKVGNAVERNRVRRRLRTLLRERLRTAIGPGWDVLVIARPAAAEATYSELAAAIDGLLARSDIGR